MKAFLKTTNQINKSPLFKVGLVIAASFLFVGCNKSSSAPDQTGDASSSLASTTIPALDTTTDTTTDTCTNTSTDTTTDTSTSTTDNSTTTQDNANVADPNPMVDCNQGAGKLYQMKIRTIKDTAGKIDTTAKLVKFTQVPASFDTENHVIAFYKWKVNSSDSYVIAPNLLYFSLVDSVTKTTLVPKARLLRWQELSYFAKKLNLSMTELFDRLTIKVLTNDSKKEYQGFEATIFSPKYKVLDNVALLTPSFLADPSQYSTDDKGKLKTSKLRFFHPFAKLIEYGVSPDQFLEKSKEFCF